MLKKLALLAGIFIALIACNQAPSSSSDAGILVHNLEEFNKASSQILPGTKIVLAKGDWRDVELRFEALGTSDSPITIEAEVAGEVIISGQSNLAFSGEYITISGLVFKNGYTPTSEVIAFRTGKNKFANNSRITNCVIDNFSNPERFDSDTWVAIYGKNNRFDHNSLLNKGNVGVTLAVKLKSEASRDNNHIIENNYFGPRAVLGSNGGETMRIGTSHYSRTYSNTLVRNNYFDRCNGEHEIISNKSCGNVFEYNVFNECQGTLTMRHGHHTTVSNNYFLGNRKPNTGGIRIINEYQTVENNYLSGLTGHRFRGALVIMNGVPNSPINRYNQVIDSKMNRNVVVNSDYIQLCAGSDEERSAIPVGSSFKENIILTNTIEQPFTIYDDVSGIEFAGNIINTEPPFQPGFTVLDYDLKTKESGLLSPSREVLDKISFAEIALPVAKEETGATYYQAEAASSFEGGQDLEVEPGTNTLLEAIEKSSPGDRLILKGGESYLLTKKASIHHFISILAKGETKPIIQSEKQNFFQIENGGGLKCMNLIFDGQASPDLAGNCVISTSKYAMNKNYSLVMEDCIIQDMDKNHSFNFLYAAKHTFADSIVLRNVVVDNLTGAVLKLDKETEDLGIYNAENIVIEDCKFIEVQSEVLNIYRGGTDESTFGPLVWISGVEIEKSGFGKRNKSKASLRFHGVQYLKVKDLSIDSSAVIDLHLSNGEPRNFFEGLKFKDCKGMQSNVSKYNSTASSIETL